MSKSTTQNNFTLLIQGPISLYTVFMLYKYKDAFPIVVSAPKPKNVKDSKIVEEIQSIAGSDSNLSLFLYEQEWPKDIYNEQNRYGQFFSTSLGLQACYTDYTIKIRSDEFYSNLEPFIEAVLDNTTKLVTNDVFFRNSTMPFHPSDHLMGGKTTLLKSIFNTSKLFCEQKDLLDKNIFINIFRSTLKDKSIFIPAEVYLGAALMAHLHPSDIRQTEIDIVKAMKHSIFIVDNEELGLIRINANSVDGGKEFFDTSYRNEATDIHDIQHYK
jgi:hypothetical protein